MMIICLKKYAIIFEATFYLSSTPLKVLLKMSVITTPLPTTATTVVVASIRRLLSPQFQKVKWLNIVGVCGVSVYFF